MAWDVVMFGALSVPELHQEDWLSSPVLREAHPFLEETAGADVLAETPEALLTFLRELALAPHELSEVNLEGGRLTAACHVSEDAYRETSGALLLLFASAAPFGGTGSLTLYGYQGIRFGEQLRIAAGRAAYVRLGHECLAELEQSPAFAALDAKIHARFDALVGRPEAPLDPRRSRLVISPFTGRTVRVPDEWPLPR